MKHIRVNTNRNQLFNGIYITELSENIEKVWLEYCGSKYFYWTKSELAKAYKNKTNLFDKYSFSKKLYGGVNYSMTFDFCDNEDEDNITAFNFDVTEDIDNEYEMLRTYKVKNIDVEFNDERLIDIPQNGKNFLRFEDVGAGVMYLS
jgi:hypothetical protein